MSDGIEDEEPDVPRDSQRKDSHGHKLPGGPKVKVRARPARTQMIDSAMKKGKLFPEIENNLAADHNMTLAQGGREAAKATLTLMRDVAQFLPPRDIIDIYEQSFVDGTAHTTALWDGHRHADGSGHGSRRPHARHALGCGRGPPAAGARMPAR